MSESTYFIFQNPGVCRDDETRVNQKFLGVCFLSLGVLAGGTSGCVNNINNFKQEAAEFCEVFDSEKWEEYKDLPGSVDLEDELNKRIGQVIKSDEFKAVVAELEQVEFLRDLYPTAQSKISALTGERWDCASYQSFYALSFEKRSDSLVPDAAGGDVVTLVIDDAGKFTVNSLELLDSRPETLKRGIETVSKTPLPNIIVKTTQGAPEASLKAVMSTLHGLGVSKVTVITHE